MMVGLRGLRGGLAAALVLFAAPAATVAAVGFSVTAAYAQTVSSIGVEGNRRIEADTVRSYFKPGPSGRLDNAAVDEGLKALINTGLFSDVRIEHRGGRLYPGDGNQRDASPVTDSSRQQEDHVRSRQQNQGDGSGCEREQRRGRRHAATVSPGTERVSIDYLPGALAGNPILE